MSNHAASEQEFIDKLNEFIENNLENEHYGVSELARELGMSPSNLLKKVKAVVNITASRYIMQFRLKKAMEILQQTSDTVSEVSYKTGFGSPSYFVKCFHDYYGYPPGKLENRSENENELQASEKPNKKRLVVIVSSAFSMVLIAAVLFIIVKPFSFQQKALEKTIAVLPFADYSPEESNAYIINGLKDEILDKLQNIGDLKVKSSTDTEKYRNTKKSTSKIGRELNVNYLLEGSGQKINNRIMLRLQLIEAKTGNHLWSNPYEKEVTDENIFDIQREVALAVAFALKTSLTPEEKQQIEKLPTENRTAYYLFLRGEDHFNIAGRYSQAGDKSASRRENRKAIELFEKAAELDSTFVKAYHNLAAIYINRPYLGATGNPQLQKAILDSGLYYINKALKYDPEGWANLLKITYLRRIGKDKEAEALEKKRAQIEQDLNMPLFKSFEFLLIESFLKDDYYDGIKYYYQYLETKPKEVITGLWLLRNAYTCFDATGYPEQAKKIAKEILVRNNDSIGYWLKLDRLNFFYENDYSLKFAQKAYEKDSTNVSTIDYLIWNEIWQRNFSDAYNYMQKEIKILEASNDTIPLYYLYGGVLLQNGFKNEAEKHFNAEIKKYTEEIDLNLPDAQKYYSHANLACTYLFKGEKEKALDYLKQTQNRETTFSYNWIKFFKVCSILDIIRNEPEFEKFLAYAETKYEKEHKRIGRLLKDLGKIE